jgi:hypothetical protein
MTTLSAGASFFGSRHRSNRKRKPDTLDETVGKGVVESERIGIFWFQKSSAVHTSGGVFHVGLQQRERIELEELLRQNFLTSKFLESTLIPLNDESSSLPRLRMFNWAVTNFSKAKAVTTQIVGADGSVRFVDPSISYNSILKRLHRTLFDPYRRGTLLYFKSEKGDVHHTTVGQILFVKWCIENGVDKYVESHHEEIRTHLNETSSQRATMGKRRVRELTSSSSKYARILPTPIVANAEGQFHKIK